METGNSVVASLEHLRVGGELHGSATSPVYSHSPHVNQLGTHDAAHDAKQGRRQIIQVCRLNTDLRAHKVASISYGHVGTR